MKQTMLGRRRKTLNDPRNDQDHLLLVTDRVIREDEAPRRPRLPVLKNKRGVFHTNVAAFG